MRYTVERLELTKLAELAVGDQQGAQSLEALQGLVGVLLAILFRDGPIGRLGALEVDLLSLPDEFLEQFTLVLRQEQLLGLVNDIAQIPDEDLAVIGELLRWRGEDLGAQGAVQGNITLFVL